MDYSLSIWSIASYIEANIREDISNKELEEISGFSYRHIRTIVKETTGLTISRYILKRKISYAAYEIKHSNKDLTEIAFEFGFTSYDSFARAFKRITSKTPRAFRNGNYSVGHRKILMGFYGPEIYKDDDMTYTQTSIKEEFTMKKEQIKSNDGCILYGVSRVAYSYEECTPLAVSIKSALNYLGDDIDYTKILCAMGAAYRLRWNLNYWDGGNIDVLNIYERQYEVFDKAFKAAGRSYQLHLRSDLSKTEFYEIIKHEIDEGRPLIALGVIGPREAGVITGYDNKNTSILGWNVFQENKEMAANVDYHQCGYYITESWWENEETVALVTIGEKTNEVVSIKDILTNGLDIMTKEHIEVIAETGNVRDVFAGGLKSFDIWSDAILDPSQFDDNMVTSLKIEKLMCQGDAQSMIGEGRSYAAIFMNRVAKEYPEVEKLAFSARDEFKASAGLSHEMFRIRGGFQQSKETLDNFMKLSIRKQSAEMINQIKEHEQKAIKAISDILDVI